MKSFLITLLNVLFGYGTVTIRHVRHFTEIGRVSIVSYIIYLDDRLIHLKSLREAIEDLQQCVALL